MSEQTNETRKSNSSSNLPELEAMKSMLSLLEVSHNDKGTIKFRTTKSNKGSKIINVEKFGKVWEVEFEYYEKEFEGLIAIDGVTEINKVYDLLFINEMEAEAMESMRPEPCQDSYNDLYEGD